jgi:hypothetical protein
MDGKGAMMRRLVWSGLLLCSLFLSISVVKASGAQEKGPDLKKIKEEIGLMESVLNEGLQQNFSGTFVLLDKARGAYLPKYGVTFSFEVNLIPSSGMGPFTPPPSPEALKVQQKATAQRREQAKALAEKTLADFGHTLSALDPKEFVTIVIHTVDIQPSGLAKGTIVIQCDKQMIDAYRANSMDLGTFLRKLTLVEY